MALRVLPMDVLLHAAAYASHPRPLATAARWLYELLAYHTVTTHLRHSVAVRVARALPSVRCLHVGERCQPDALALMLDRAPRAAALEQLRLRLGRHADNSVVLYEAGVGTRLAHGLRRLLAGAPVLRCVHLQLWLHPLSPGAVAAALAAMPASVEELRLDLGLQAPGLFDAPGPLPDGTAYLPSTRAALPALHTLYLGFDNNHGVARSLGRIAHWLAACTPRRVTLAFVNTGGTITGRVPCGAIVACLGVVARAARHVALCMCDVTVDDGAGGHEGADVLAAADHLTLECACTPAGERALRRLIGSRSRGSLEVFLLDDAGMPVALPWFACQRLCVSHGLGAPHLRAAAMAGPYAALEALSIILDRWDGVTPHLVALLRPDVLPALRALALDSHHDTDPAEADLIALLDALRRIDCRELTLAFGGDLRPCATLLRHGGWFLRSLGVRTYRAPPVDALLAFAADLATLRPLPDAVCLRIPCHTADHRLEALGWHVVLEHGTPHVHWSRGIAADGQ